MPPFFPRFAIAGAVLMMRWNARAESCNCTLRVADRSNLRPHQQLAGRIEPARFAHTHVGGPPTYKVHFA